MGEFMNDFAAAQVTLSKQTLFPSQSITVDPSIRFIRARTDATTGTMTLTLPDPAQVAGAFIYARVDARSGSNNLVLVAKGLSNITLDAAAEDSLLFSTGRDYREVVGNHA